MNNKGTISNEDLVSEKKATYKYHVRNKKGQKFYGYLDAYNKENVVSYLKNDGYIVLDVEKQSKLKALEVSSPKLKDSELSFMLTQLSTYLKARLFS